MPSNGAQRNVDKLAALQKTGLFRGLPSAVLTKAASCAIARRLSAGEVLFSERDKASGLYIVVEGELRSIRRNQDGREQVLSTGCAGAIVGAVPVFNGGNCYNTTIADVTCQVLCIPTHDVHEMCREYPELLWKLLRVFGQKLCDYAEVIEMLALRNVDQRLAQHLVSVCQERGVHRGDTCVVEITMTRTAIANRLGSTREVICRAIAHLQKSGLIQLKSSRLFTVPSLGALRRFAGTEPALEEASEVAGLSSASDVGYFSTITTGRPPSI
jgi:CRP/FNR family transcriptional regulator